MTQKEIGLLRLRNQQIHGGTMSCSELLAHMGAMQSQDYMSGLWSIGLRTNLTKGEVEQAIKNKEIARTWPQRGTLHFVHAKDASWQLALSAPRLIKGLTSRHARLEITDEILISSGKILQKALKGGRILSRAEILKLFESSGVATTNGRGYHLLWYLSQTGLIIEAPMASGDQTFTLLSEWIKDPTPKTTADSVIELVKRYFTSHGPATMQDFMWWSGVTAVQAKAAISANEHILTKQKEGGKEYIFAAGLPLEKESPTAYLLPPYDEYILGYKDRSDVLPAEHANKIIPGGNGVFMPTIVIDGQVVGTWKKEIKKDKVMISLFPFETFSAKEMKLITEAANKYGRFLELTASLVI